MEGECPNLSLHFHHQIGLHYLNQKIITHVRVGAILLENVCAVWVSYNISSFRILDQEYCIPLEFFYQVLNQIQISLGQLFFATASLKYCISPIVS